MSEAPVNSAAKLAAMRTELERLLARLPSGRPPVYVVWTADVDETFISDNGDKLCERVLGLTAEQMEARRQRLHATGRYPQAYWEDFTQQSLDRGSGNGITRCQLRQFAKGRLREHYAGAVEVAQELREDLHGLFGDQVQLLFVPITAGSWEVGGNLAFAQQADAWFGLQWKWRKVLDGDGKPT